MDQTETLTEKPKVEIVPIEEAFRTEAVLDGAAVTDEEPAFDVSVVWHSIRRRWPSAILLGLCFGPILAFTVFKLIQPPAGAVAYLQIDAVDAPLAFHTADQVGGGRNAFDLFKNTQRQLMRTPLVLNAVLADNRVKSLPILEELADPQAWIKDGLDIEFPGRGEVMSITFLSDSNATSIAVVDAIITAYMKEAGDDNANERRARLKRLEDVYANTDAKVRKRRAAILDLADSLGTGDSQSLSMAQQLSIQRYGQIQTQLGTLKFDWLRGRGEVETLKLRRDKLLAMQERLQSGLDDSLASASSALESPATSPAEDTQLATLTTSDDDRGSDDLGDNVGLTALQDDDGTAAADQAAFSSDLNDSSARWELTEVEKSAVLSNDRIYQQLYTEARQIKDEIDLYRTQYGEGMLQHKRSRLERLTLELNKRREEAITIATDSHRKQMGLNEDESLAHLSPEQRKVALKIKALSEKLAENQQAILDRQISNGILEQQVERIEQDLQELEAETKQLGRSSVELEMMRLEVASLGEVLNRLASEMERTNIEMRSSSRVKVLSYASKLASHDFKKTLLTASAAGLVGLCFPFIGLVGLDLSSKLVNDPKTISREISVPVLGSVPRENRLYRVFEKERLAEGPFGNSVGSIVAILVNRARCCDFNTIMVSSAMPGEGKSTLSHSLWRGLSEANYNVVIVDFDLRHPALHHDLGVEVGSGLGDILVGDANIDECLHRHTDKRAYLTAGSPHRVNLAAAAQDMLPQLFNELRSRFDFVIVDTAPILPVVDTRIIGEYVDGCVLSVMRDKSRVPQVVAAVETLKAHGSPLLGVVVSGCKGAHRDVGYYYSDKR